MDTSHCSVILRSWVHSPQHPWPHARKGSGRGRAFSEETPGLTQSSHPVAAAPELLDTWMMLLKAESHQLAQERLWRINHGVKEGWLWGLTERVTRVRKAPTSYLTVSLALSRHLVKEYISPFLLPDLLPLGTASFIFFFSIHTHSFGSSGRWCQDPCTLVRSSSPELHSCAGQRAGGMDRSALDLAPIAPIPALRSLTSAWSREFIFPTL